ncbi:MAG: hypothetical protein IT433_09370 [Phycisphaerales bacterium]|nr:hypothetical protein [Phycisphaerales bacterium]
MNTTAVATIVCVCTSLAAAQPTEFIDLGRLDHPVTMSTPVHLRFAGDVAWLRFEVPRVTASSGFVDIWTRYELRSALVLESPRAMIYDNLGHRVRGLGGAGSSAQVFGSLGQEAPRRPQNIVDNDYGDVHGGCYGPFQGDDGALDAGVYWLALANGVAGFNDDWAVAVSVPTVHQPERDTTLYIRVHPPEIPFCDPDLNWDGNADQDDVAYLIDLITNPSPIDPTNACGADPDYNRDGTADMDDVRTLIDVIASGECPP